MSSDRCHLAIWCVRHHWRYVLFLALIDIADTRVVLTDGAEPILMLIEDRRRSLRFGWSRKALLWRGTSISMRRVRVVCELRLRRRLLWLLLRLLLIASSVHLTLCILLCVRYDTVWSWRGNRWPL